MAMKELIKRWIVLSEGTTKTIGTSIKFDDVRMVIMDSKLTDGKLKRTIELMFEDGSSYVIPDDATVLHAPVEYTELVGYMAQQVKV